MIIAGLQFLLVLFGTLLVIGILLRWRNRRVAPWAALVVVAALVPSIWALERHRVVTPDEEDVENRPIQVEENGYVSSSTCRSCHPHEWTTWHGSYHRKMTQVANPESVIGAFDGSTHRVLDRSYKLVGENGQYFVDIFGSNAHEPERRPIVMTTGSHHMQAYWYATGDRRSVELLPLVYLRGDERWVTERSTFLKPSWEQLGATKLESTAGLWNRGCQQCHATAPQPHVETMDTKVAELGIACEACHGPAHEHVEVNRDIVRRYKQRFSEEGDPTITDPSDLDPHRASSICGQCHGNWQSINKQEDELSKTSGYSFRPGDPLERSKFTVHQGSITDQRVRNIARAEPFFLGDRYWGDGMVRVSGREFPGLLDSPCYKDASSDERKLSCLSCHQMHKAGDDPRSMEEWADDQLKPGMRGNDACVGCHEEFRDVAKLTEHTHHAVGSSGSKCYNCHMPYTTYGLLKAIRSHTISKPSVTESVRLGRPNACNLCHLDRTLGWTADHLDEWWKVSSPNLDADQQVVAASILWLLSGDAGQRGLVAWAYGWEDARKTSGTAWMMPYIAPLLIDPYAAVRYVAHRSLRTLPEATKIEYDFMGPLSQRLSAVSGYSTHWRLRFGTLQRPSAISMDPGSFDRLYGNRDDRRVNLEE